MRLRSAGSLATSVLLHAFVLASGAWLLSQSLTADVVANQPPTLVEVVVVDDDGIELPGLAQGGVLAAETQTTEAEPPKVDPLGGERLPRPDMERAGRGGAPTSPSALNLASSIDHVTLAREIMNALHRSQAERLRTSEQRRSHDDRRATPKPMTMTFVVSGAGERRERRPVARFDPSRGELHRAKPTRVGGRRGAEPELDGQTPTTTVGAAREGDTTARPAAGVDDGEARRDVRASADVTQARPALPVGRAALPTETRGRPNDIVDSPQEVASTTPSVLSASTAGGRPGAERGGQHGAGVAGVGGPAAVGSRSETAGFGPGPRRSAAEDPRVTSWMRDIRSRVDPYWQRAFPDWAIAEGRGGVAIVGMTIHADGRVSGVRVVRGSGIAEFDRNVVDAVQRAAPFGPPPKTFSTPLRIKISFDATNPAVARGGPGPGRGARR